MPLKPPVCQHVNTPRTYNFVLIVRTMVCKSKTHTTPPRGFSIFSFGADFKSHKMKHKPSYCLILLLLIDSCDTLPSNV